MVAKVLDFKHQTTFPAPLEMAWSISFLAFILIVIMKTQWLHVSSTDTLNCSTFEGRPDSAEVRGHCLPMCTCSHVAHTMQHFKGCRDLLVLSTPFYYLLPIPHMCTMLHTNTIHYTTLHPPYTTLYTCTIPFIDHTITLHAN